MNKASEKNSFICKIKSFYFVNKNFIDEFLIAFFFGCFCAIAIYLNGGLPLTNSIDESYDNKNHILPTEYFPLLILSLIFLGVFFYLYFKKYRAHVLKNINFNLIYVLLGIYILYQIIRLAININWHSYDFTYIVDPSKEDSEIINTHLDINFPFYYAITDIFNETLMFILLLSAFFCFKQMKNKQIFVVILTCMISLVVYINFFYSLGKEMDLIKQILKFDFPGHGIKGLFVHWNLYAFICYLGMLSLMYVNNRMEKYYYIFIFTPLILINYFIILLTLCNTVIFISTLTLFFYFIFRLAVRYKENKTIFFVMLGLFVFFIVILLLTLTLNFVLDTEFSYKIKKIIEDVFVNKQIFDTVVSRNKLIRIDIEILNKSNPMNVLFGFSHSNFVNIFRTYNSIVNPYDQVDKVHNFYFQALSEFGLFGLMIRLAFISYILSYFIEGFKFNKIKFNYLPIIYLIGLFIYSNFESRFVTYNDLASSICSIIFIIFLSFDSHDSQIKYKNYLYNVKILK